MVVLLVACSKFESILFYLLQLCSRQWVLKRSIVCLCQFLLQEVKEHKAPKPITEDSNPVAIHVNKFDTPIPNPEIIRYITHLNF